MPLLLDMEEGTKGATYTLKRKSGIAYIQTEFRRTYLVLADYADQPEEEIKNTTGIPPLGYILNGSICQSISPKEERTIKHPFTGVQTILYKVDCEFNSEMDGAAEPKQQPPAQRPKVRWYGECEDEVLEKDPVTGEAIQTVNGEPLLITAPVVCPILEITRYEYYPFNPSIQLAYANRVNSSPFWGAPVGCALMLPIEVESEQVGYTMYDRATYKIKFKIKLNENGGFKANTWRAEVLHQGYMVRDSAELSAPDPYADIPHVNVDKHGNPATVNLTLDGTKLPSGEEKVYMTFNRFCYANLNALSLGPF
jgi:archaellum component FlaF (FlaF/FlaG flagellin family)